MGMFDKPNYLTGKGEDGYVKPGDTFWLHNAKPEGEVTIGSDVRAQAKLLVSRERDGDKEIVYTSGIAIVGQVKRMDATDRNNMPVELRLDELPPRKKGQNPTNVLTPASEPQPDPGGFGASEDPADF